MMDEKQNHVSSLDAQSVVRRAMTEASKADHWMVVVWAVEDGHIRMLDRTTWQFPRGDYPAAIDQLKTSCQQEVAAVETALPIDPLPLAMLQPAGFENIESPEEIEEDPFL